MGDPFVDTNIFLSFLLRYGQKHSSRFDRVERVEP